MSRPEIFRGPIPKEAVLRLAHDEFEDMIKFVVDLEKKIICAGGGLHSDEEQLLLEQGSQQEGLWGGNYYLNDSSDQRFEYTSMINIRPANGNKSQDIQSEELKARVKEIAAYFFESKI